MAPKIPRLSTRKKVDTSLRDAKGNVRPEQKKAMKRLTSIGKSAAKPYIDTAKRIFKKSTAKKKESVNDKIKTYKSAQEEHKRRLEEAMNL